MHPYYVGLDVHKQVIAFCVKTASGEIFAEGTNPATRSVLTECVKIPVGTGTNQYYVVLYGTGIRA